MGTIPPTRRLRLVQPGLCSGRAFLFRLLLFRNALESCEFGAHRTPPDTLQHRCAPILKPPADPARASFCKSSKLEEPLERADFPAAHPSIVMRDPDAPGSP